MKYTSVYISLIIMFTSNLIASWRTDKELNTFGGFDNLLANTDVIAIVQFESGDNSIFRVVEMLYPKMEHIPNYFASFENNIFGMLSMEYNPESSYEIVAGGKYLIFLRRLDHKSRRWLNHYRDFVIPSYACSYRLSDNSHGAIPLFDLMDPVIFAKIYANTSSAEVNRDDERGRVIRRINEDLLRIYGVTETDKIVEAIKDVVKIASAGRSLPSSTKSDSIYKNIILRKIIDDITDGTMIKAGILDYPPPPNDYSKEPPARKQNLDALRKSPLSKLKIISFKADGIPFNKALDLAEITIRKESGFEDFHFIVGDMLKEDMSRSAALVHMNIRNSTAWVVIKFLASDMYIEMRDNNTVYIDLL
jgi:hypothetical protein